jgi:outer membrane biosynthesis protein TonB
MGMVKFRNRRTGQEVEAEFPLHPMLVNATAADGSALQVMRPDWDRDYAQELPVLPAIDPNSIPTGEGRLPRAHEYEAPTLVQLAKPETVPQSHAAWFTLLYDVMVTVERKLDMVIDELAKPAPEAPPAPEPAPEPPPEPPPPVPEPAPEPAPEPEPTTPEPRSKRHR